MTPWAPDLTVLTLPLLSVSQGASSGYTQNVACMIYMLICRSETVYCMNEAELVDIALCILAEGKGAEVTSSEDEVQEPQHMLSDHHSSSVSDINISGTGSTPPKVLDALSSSENTKSEDDDDALKYVREIFFT
uniref:Uncharacterized protein n=1 Tax=Varanus komodoensis TaxID=61221 RepID=A0A8D2Q0M2_VARKO